MGGAAEEQGAHACRVQAQAQLLRHPGDEAGHRVDQQAAKVASFSGWCGPVRCRASHLLFTLLIAMAALLMNDKLGCKLWASAYNSPEIFSKAA